MFIFLSLAERMPLLMLKFILTASHRASRRCKASLCLILEEGVKLSWRHVKPYYVEAWAYEVTNSQLAHGALSAVAFLFGLINLNTLFEMPFFFMLHYFIFWIHGSSLHIISCLFFLWDPASGWVVI